MSTYLKDEAALKEFITNRPARYSKPVEDPSKETNLVFDPTSLITFSIEKIIDAIKDHHTQAVTRVEAALRVLDQAHKDFDTRKNLHVFIQIFVLAVEAEWNYHPSIFVTPPRNEAIELRPLVIAAELHAVTLIFDKLKDPEYESEIKFARDLLSKIPQEFTDSWKTNEY
ncbi:hypothetical protein BASA81_002551 [Batrachochytrium salamandrivorans]|nr:hypothetical protein BASA81_002551 [Batrachochytrium salamandrivorans]